MATQRRKFTDEEKRTILRKAGEKGVSAVLHEYHLSYSVLARWKKQLLGDSSTAQHNQARQEIKHLSDENMRLKKIIAEQALELERKEEELKKYVPYGKR
ncbi:MAG: transposase [Chitinophagaceae bacterium]